MKLPLRCGICNREFKKGESVEDHQTSKEHLANMADPEIIARIIESQIENVKQNTEG